VKTEGGNAHTNEADKLPFQKRKKDSYKGIIIALSMLISISISTTYISISISTTYKRANLAGK
jgi:hypothetical protein